MNRPTTGIRKNPTKPSTAPKTMLRAGHAGIPHALTRQQVLHDGSSQRHHGRQGQHPPGQQGLLEQRPDQDSGPHDQQAGDDEDHDPDQTNDDCRADQCNADGFHRGIVPAIGAGPRSSSTPVGAGSVSSDQDSVLVVGRAGRCRGQLAGLVVPLHGERTKFRFVAAAVMAAEQQFAATCENGANIGLSAAAVAAVGGPKGAEDSCGHGAPLGGRSDVCSTMKTGFGPSSSIHGTRFAMSEAFVVRDSTSGASRLGRQDRQLLWQRHRGNRRTHVSAQPAELPLRASSEERAAGGYTARHLSVLEGLEAVRKRPGMYVGSTDSRGLMHCLWEIIDNGVDEALAGQCTTIEVLLDPDGSVEVRDNGRGIPVDIHDRTGLSGVEVVFTKLHAGGKFGGGSYAASGGLHGVGASVVNALAARLDVEVDRDGKTYAMSFRRGEPGMFAGDGPDADFTAFTDRSELRVAGRRRKNVSGTRIRFWPDRQIFLPDAAFSFDELLTRARQTSYLVPGLELVLRDQRGAEPEEHRFRHAGGIVEFAQFLASDAPVSDVIRLHGAETFTETVPILDDAGHMTPRTVERQCEVDVALRWGVGYDTELRSFVNVIATPKGGTHVAGFEQGLLKSLREQVRANSRRLKAGDDKIEKDDVLEGMTALVTVRLAEPQFEGQTKEVLGTSAVRGIVARVVERRLTATLSSSKRADRAQAAAVLEKVVAAAKATGRRPAAQGDRSAQERPGDQRPAHQTGRLPLRGTGPL